VPLYDYVCAACGRRFEVIHGVHGDPPTSCPLCGEGPVRKAISAPAVHYRGSGWAKKERRAAVKSGATKGDGDEASTGASSAADDGSSKDSGSSGTEAGSSDVGTAAAATGDGSKTTDKPSKSGSAAVKKPARDRD
jgi:putative FmdB family regulatory protein